MKHNITKRYTNTCTFSDSRSAYIHFWENACTGKMATVAEKLNRTSKRDLMKAYRKSLAIEKRALEKALADSTHDFDFMAIYGHTVNENASFDKASFEQSMDTLRARHNGIDDGIGDFTTPLLTEDVTEKKRVNHYRKIWASKYQYMPIDAQKDLFSEYEQGNIDRFSVVFRCGVFNRAIFKYLLKWHPQLYFDCINPSIEKPYDVPDMVSDCLIALMDKEANTGKDTFTLALNEWGISVLWETEDDMKTFYRTLRNKINASRGGRGTFRDSKGNKIQRFYEMVSIENMTFEIEAGNAVDLYSLYGDDVVLSIIGLHWEFFSALSSVEKDVFQLLLEYGQNVHKVAEKARLTDYKVRKVYLPSIKAKWEEYEKPLVRKASKSPCNLYGNKDFTANGIITTCPTKWVKKEA